MMPIDCDIHEFLKKFKQKYPKKYNNFANRFPRKFLHLFLARCGIGKFGFIDKYKRYYFIDDDKKTVFTLGFKEVERFGKFHQDNICILFDLNDSTILIIFENIENLTIKEFYRKIMS